jgi:predicted SAM-dependent methyltransferase
MPVELLIGAGSNHSKRMTVDGTNRFSNLVTLDYNADHKPDVVWDLHQLPLPFADNSFDEIHAYEVLEHVGSQGDYRCFFAQFTEFWRLLRPGGFFMATCPSRHSRWAWGDPSHTRILTQEQLHFLTQEHYRREVGVTTMSDFRNIYQADFQTYFVSEDQLHLCFILQALK